MSTFTDRINVIIDVATERAKAGLADFRKSVADADGFTGKLRAGVTSLSGAFTAAASSPAVLGSAVAAAGAAAFKVASDVANLGVEIGRFSDATGLSAEQSSRWVEVSGDIGIQAESLQTVIGKLNRSVDPAVFAEYGIAIAKTAEGTTDANQTFLNTIDALHRMKDPAEQAAAAAKLLGRGWQGIAEIIGMSSAEIEDRLASVADVKVFDDEKIQKSRDFRDAMQDVKDKLEEAAMTIGSDLVPEVKGLIEALGFVVTTATQAAGAVGALAGSSGVMSVDDYTDSVKALGDQFFHTTWAIRNNVHSIDDLRDAVAEMKFANDKTGLAELAAAIENTGKAAKEGGVAYDFGHARMKIMTAEATSAKSEIHALSESERAAAKEAYAQAQANDTLSASIHRVKESVDSINGSMAGEGARNGSRPTYYAQYQAAQAAQAAKEAAKAAGKATKDEVKKTKEDIARELDQLTATKFEFGDITEDQYRTYLNKRLGALKKYSADWIAIKKELRALDDLDERRRKEAADAEEKLLKEQQKAADEAAEAEKKRLEEEQKAAEEAQRAKEAAVAKESSDAALQQALNIGTVIVQTAGDSPRRWLDELAWRVI